MPDKLYGAIFCNVLWGCILCFKTNPHLQGPKKCQLASHRHEAEETEWLNFHFWLNLSFNSNPFQISTSVAHLWQETKKTLYSTSPSVHWNTDKDNSEREQNKPSLRWCMSFSTDLVKLQTLHSPKSNGIMDVQLRSQAAFYGNIVLPSLTAAASRDLWVFSPRSKSTE